MQRLPRANESHITNLISDSKMVLHVFLVNDFNFRKSLPVFRSFMCVCFFVINRVQMMVMTPPPALVMVDSIQTMRTGDSTSSPGSVTQVSISSHCSPSDSSELCFVRMVKRWLSLRWNVWNCYYQRLDARGLKALASSILNISPGMSKFPQTASHDSKVLKRGDTSYSYTSYTASSSIPTHSNSARCTVMSRSMTEANLTGTNLP